MSLTAEYYLPLWEGWGGLPRGWLLMDQQEGLAGMSHVQESWSLIEVAATGAQFSRSYYLALLAEGHQHHGQVGDGLTSQRGVQLCGANARPHSSHNSLVSSRTFRKTGDVECLGRGPVALWQRKGNTGKRGCGQNVRTEINSVGL